MQHKKPNLPMKWLKVVMACKLQITLTKIFKSKDCYADFWFLPTHGDQRYLGTSVGARPATYSYLKQIAKAADRLGFNGVLVPSGRSCEDPWVVSASLINETERLKFLVAVRPGFTSPTVSARMASTLDRISGGRLLINVVAGGDPEEQQADGSFLQHDERYTETGEFLKVWKAVLQGETISLDGEYIRVKDARLPSGAHQNLTHHYLLADPQTRQLI